VHATTSIRAQSWSVLLAIATIAACDSPRIQVRRADLPPVKTFVELKAKYDTTHARTCDFPEVAADPAWPTLGAVDGLAPVQLPLGWRLQPLPDTNTFGEVEWVLTGPREARIRLSHVTSGAIGARWSARNQRGDPAEGLQCLIEREPAGAIWTLYAPGAVFTMPDSTGRVPPRHSALGDLISAAGERFQVRLGAISGPDRDTLARLVSESILNTPAPPGPAAPN
jgi:hypothetical protein